MAGRLVLGAAVAVAGGTAVAGTDVPAPRLAAIARASEAASQRSAPSPGAIRVTDAWVREPVPGRTVAAAYAVIENPSSAHVDLVGATADVAGSAEMHEMVRSGDVMKMGPVRTIGIPARGKAELRPGGLHLMLFDLKRPLKHGDTVNLTFALSTGATVSTAAPVKRGTMP